MSGGFDVQSVITGGVGVGMVAAVGQWFREHRKVTAEADRDEATLPLDLVHQATTVASDQMAAMAAEMERLRARFEAAEADNDRLRAQLRAARSDLDLAQAHLVQMWHRLAAVDPTMVRPDWLPE